MVLKMEKVYMSIDFETFWLGERSKLYFRIITKSNKIGKEYVEIIGKHLGDRGVRILSEPWVSGRSVEKVSEDLISKGYLQQVIIFEVRGKSKHEDNYFEKSKIEHNSTTSAVESFLRLPVIELPSGTLELISVPEKYEDMVIDSDGSVGDELYSSTIEDIVYKLVPRRSRRLQGLGPYGLRF
jgi:hypothetical protein